MKYRAGSRRRASEYEPALVEWWKKNKTFEKSVEQRPIDDSFVFYDGPPFITGMPHHGTLLSSIVKDAVPRYWTMRGKRVERRWGWDCHGLPAENFVEKQLGITDRREIGTKWSLEDYILKARESMVANSETWEGTIDRVGRWVDFKGAYRTMDKDFMESVWWAFKTLYEAGKIYEGAKVLMYDTKFATPVSKSEVTMDNDAYQEVTDPSAFVKFKLTNESSEQLFSGHDVDSPRRHGRVASSSSLVSSGDSRKDNSDNSLENLNGIKAEEPVYLLAWTTTPWTLAGNMALAVNPEMEYVAVRVDGVRKLYILAKSQCEKVFSGREIEIVYDGIKGSDLVGLSYEPLDVKSGSKKPIKSYLMGVSDVDEDLKKIGAEFKKEDGDYLVTLRPEQLEAYEKLVGEKLRPEYWNEHVDNGKVTFLFKMPGGKVERYVWTEENRVDEKRIGKLIEQFSGSFSGVKNMLEGNGWYGKGILSPVESSSVTLVDWKKFEKNYYPASERQAHKVYAAEFVSDSDGTGIVHIAPAYGEDDYKLGRENGVPCVDVLDEYGCYLSGADVGLKAAGVRPNAEGQIQIWEANKFIAKCLEENGPIEKIEYIKHEYPFNPRSKQRIMYRAFPSWFFDVQGQKDLMIAQNENINWFPGYLKEGRFKKNIEQAPDWNLSRDRFWATAMPVWKGDKGTVKVVGSYAELKELSGVELEDYHRPWVDEIEFDIDGEHFKRIEKVLDCWFESGSMPFAQLHYPFENKEKFERNYPADFIVEYVGQVRAWFYYVHVVNTALAEVGGFGKVAQERAEKNAFKNVITTGTLAGNDGRKMSKSLGNYTDPNTLMDQYSADALRFLLLSSPVLSGEDFALTDKDVSDVARKLAMIWNVYDFFVTYAEVDGWQGPDLAMQHSPSSEPVNLSKSNPAGRDFDPVQPGDAPQTTNVAEPASGYMTADGHWAGGLKNPLDQWIIARLHQLKKEVIDGMEEYNIPKALAGVLPFVDDLSNWFVRRSRRRFWKSEDDNDKAEAYWTLWKVLSNLSRILAPFTPFLAEELWQKTVGGDDPEMSVHLQAFPMTTDVDEEILAEMARVRAVINEGLALRMQKSETEAQVKVRQPLAKLVYAGEKLPEWAEEIVKDEVNVKAVENGESTWIDKEITPELAEEGFVRELIRAVQSARKKAGLNVDDRIRLSLSVEVPEAWKEVLMREVLAEELVEGGNYGYDEIAKVNGENVTVSLERV